MSRLASQCFQEALREVHWLQAGPQVPGCHLQMQTTEGERPSAEEAELCGQSWHPAKE